MVVACFRVVAVTCFLVGRRVGLEVTRLRLKINIHPKTEVTIRLICLDLTQNITDGLACIAVQHFKGRGKWYFGIVCVLLEVNFESIFGSLLWTALVQSLRLRCVFSYEGQSEIYAVVEMQLASLSYDTKNSWMYSVKYSRHIATVLVMAFVR